jgi:hypothetical protein
MEQPSTLEDIFVGAVRKASSSSIADVLAKQGLNSARSESVSGASSSSTGSTGYWYTVAGAGGWKLQKQIVRCEASNRRAPTGECRVLDDKDEPVIYGTERAIQKAIQDWNFMSEDDLEAPTQRRVLLEPLLVDSCFEPEDCAHMYVTKAGVIYQRTDQHSKVQSWLTMQGLAMQGSLGGLQRSDSNLTWTE